MDAPLISAAELERRLAAEPPTVLDVRWELSTGPQRDAYLAGHIPGAVFVDLDADLSALPGAGGRHPLPTGSAFAVAMRRCGVSDGRPVVVYDGGAGMAAARAWWLLRYFGHPAVTVLDGGLAAWAGDLAAGDEVAPAGDFVARAGGMPLVDADGARRLVADGGLLLDARAPERYRGDVEPLDPVAGHIPGALNLPAAGLVGPDGRLREPATVRAELERVGAAPGQMLGAYCGSGVTAAYLVLALQAAGVPATLYAGSWSDWITDPDRPVATGPDP